MTELLPLRPLSTQQIKLVLSVEAPGARLLTSDEEIDLFVDSRYPVPISDWCIDLKKLIRSCLPRHEFLQKTLALFQESFAHDLACSSGGGVSWFPWHRPLLEKFAKLVARYPTEVDKPGFRSEVLRQPEWIERLIFEDYRTLPANFDISFSSTSTELESFLLKLRCNKKEGSLMDGMRWQIVYEARFNVVHYNAIDIEYRDSKFNVLMVDAADHRRDHHHVTLTRVLTALGDDLRQLFTVIGGLQYDQESCAIFATDHAIQMSRCEDLHEQVRSYSMRYPADIRLPEGIDSRHRHIFELSWECLPPTMVRLGQHRETAARYFAKRPEHRATVIDYRQSWCSCFGGKALTLATFPEMRDIVIRPAVHSTSPGYKKVVRSNCAFLRVAKKYNDLAQKELARIGGRISDLGASISTMISR